MPPAPNLRPPDQLPLFSSSELRPVALPRTSRRSLRTPYLPAILRFVMYHRVATVAQIHREFFAAAGKRRQYCAALLRSFETHGYLQTRRVHKGGSGRPIQVYQITGEGAMAVGVEPSERLLRRLSDQDLEARLQLTEVIQVRADEGWRPVRPDIAFRFLKRWALKAHSKTSVDHTARMLLEKQPDETAMRHNVLIRGGDARTPDEVRVLLQVSERRNLRSNLKGLPSFYGMPPIVFEVVTLDPLMLPTVEAALQRLAKKRKFQFSVVVAPHFLNRPQPDAMTSAELMEQARRPAGWEPWLRS